MQINKLRERWGLRVVKVNQFFSRPIGMLAAISLMILIVFIYFAHDNQNILTEIKNATRNTETIVSKQDETLEAIKQVAIDNNLTSRQSLDTIICMLQVPVSERTTDTEAQCRKKAEASPATNPTVDKTIKKSQVQPSAVHSSEQQTQSPTPPEEQNPPIATEPPNDSILPGNQSPALGCLDLLGVGVCL